MHLGMVISAILDIRGHTQVEGYFLPFIFPSKIPWYFLGFVQYLDTLSMANDFWFGVSMLTTDFVIHGYMWMIFQF